VEGYGLHSSDEAQSTEQAYLNKTRRDKKNVVETGWKFGQPAS